MLIEFSVGNYLSFKDIVTFSMVGEISVKEHEDTNVITGIEKFKLLKTAVIYGANGSGKSNLIKSITFMKFFILNSFRNSLIDENYEQNKSINKFLLNSETENLPSHFEIVFNHQGKRYRYGFELDNEKVNSEWLFFVNTTKEVTLFTREGQKIEINKKSFIEGKNLEEKTRDNVLFLSVVAQFNGTKSNEIINWFGNNLKITSGLDDYFYNTYTIEKLETDENFRIWVNNFVDFLGLSQVSTEKQSLDVKNIKTKDKDIQKFLDVVKILQEKQKDPLKISTWHKKFDENNKVVDNIAFDLDISESEGTKKLIYLLGPLYDVLKNNKVLIIDEFDTRLHTLLTLRLIELFNKKNIKAQLIFVSHDTNLLKKELFRRDQIWFTEKNGFGATDLYSLVEYKEHRVRNDASFNKNYLEGKYGAIPYFGNIEELLNLIYEK